MTRALSTRALSLPVVLAVALVGVAVLGLASTATAAASTIQASTLLPQLTVRASQLTGYDRDLFRHWSDADGDGCDTRREVLLRQARVLPTVLAGCRLAGGRWWSAYDNLFITDAGALDIDHFVPLSEAWQSGAWRWSAGTREAFANDLDYPLSLIAVTATTNRQKSDQDPAEWLPAFGRYRCTYVASWIAVKWRWRLAVDRVEAAALRAGLTGCGVAGRVPKPARAAVALGPSEAAPAAAPTGSGGVDARYPYCSDAIAAGLGPYRQGVDPEYDWYRDGDGDGLVCER
jgi:hypothetical protein